MLPFEGAEGFDWDSGNLLKVWDTHEVLPSECEEVFVNQPFGGRPDEQHSAREERHFAYGRTAKRRLLTIVYTMRGTLIRVISARPMNRKEKKEYAEAIAADTGI